jgi:sugar phosphate isomerase/epimerase
MHPRLSLHQVAFMSESTGDFLAFCNEAGFANAVLAAPKLEAEGIKSLPATAPKIASLNQVFDAARFEATLDLAVQIGAQSLYLLTGGRGALDWENAAQHFSRAIKPGLARGLPILIENAPVLYADIHFVHTLADTVRLAEMAEAGICIELFACWAEADLGVLFRRAMPRVGLVQVSDYVLGDRALPCRAVPGDGAIPLERLIGDILAAGYAGLFDIELVGPRIVAEGPRNACKRAGDYMSELLVKLGA